MQKNNPQSKHKKTYEKPRLRKLALRADEVLAVGCKATLPNSAGALGIGNCVLRGCSAAGS